MAERVIWLRVKVSQTQEKWVDLNVLGQIISIRKETLVDLVLDGKIKSAESAK